MGSRPAEMIQNGRVGAVGVRKGVGKNRQVTVTTLVVDLLSDPPYRAFSLRQPARIERSTKAGVPKGVSHNVAEQVAQHVASQSAFDVVMSGDLFRHTRDVCRLAAQVSRR